MATRYLALFINIIHLMILFYRINVKFCGLSHHQIPVAANRIITHLKQQEPGKKISQVLVKSNLNII
jgi:hypothetical protein